MRESSTTTSLPQATLSHPTKPRLAWRQRVVDAERGFTAGFRANSALFLYFFTTSISLSIGGVLGLSGLQWALLVLSITVALSSEMLYFSLQKMVEKHQSHWDQEMRELLSIASSALMLLLTGSIVTIVVIMGDRLIELYG